MMAREVSRCPSRRSRGLATYIARDGFNQTAGALTGKTADVGGTWTGAGDTDDFNVCANGNITRARLAIPSHDSRD